MTRGTHHVKPRGRLGQLIRDNAPDEAIEEARRELKEATVQNYIERIVDGAPPLTADQRRRLAALLMQEAC